MLRSLVIKLGNVKGAFLTTQFYSKLIPTTVITDKDVKLDLLFSFLYCLLNARLDRVQQLIP